MESYVSDKIKPVSMWLHSGGSGGSENLHLVLLDFTYVPPLFADFSLYQFAFIYHNNEYNNFMTPVSPSSKLCSLREVLGTPNTSRDNFPIY